MLTLNSNIQHTLFEDKSTKYSTKQLFNRKFNNPLLAHFSSGKWNFKGFGANLEANDADLLQVVDLTNRDGSNL